MQLIQTCLEYFLSEIGKGSFPVIINIHGVRWLSCDKRDFHLHLTHRTLERGYAVTAINCRLSKGTLSEAHICRSACCGLSAKTMQGIQAIRYKLAQRLHRVSKNHFEQRGQNSDDERRLCGKRLARIAEHPFR